VLARKKKTLKFFLSIIDSAKRKFSSHSHTRDARKFYHVRKVHFYGKEIEKKERKRWRNL
jgi:hypothetical protein